jgi:hypothetical protein
MAFIGRLSAILRDRYNYGIILFGYSTVAISEHIRLEPDKHNEPNCVPRVLATTDDLVVDSNMSNYTDPVLIVCACIVLPVQVDGNSFAGELCC